MSIVCLGLSVLVGVSVCCLLRSVSLLSWSGRAKQTHDVNIAVSLGEHTHDVSADSLGLRNRHRDISRLLASEAIRTITHTMPPQVKA